MCSDGGEAHGTATDGPLMEHHMQRNKVTAKPRAKTRPTTAAEKREAAAYEKDFLYALVAHAREDIEAQKKQAFNETMARADAAAAERGYPIDEDVTRSPRELFLERVVKTAVAYEHKLEREARQLRRADSTHDYLFEMPLEELLACAPQ